MQCTYKVTQLCVGANIVATQTQLRVLSVLLGHIGTVNSINIWSVEQPWKIKQRILFALVSNYKYLVLLTTE